MITSTQIKKSAFFAFIAVLVFKLLSCKVLSVNIKNRLLRIRLLFNKIDNFTGRLQENYKQLECEIFSTFKVELSPSKKICLICFMESSLKMLFISSQKLFSFSRYLSFYHDFLVMQKKRLDQKDKVNFKIHDVTTWLTNNCNAHISQYFKR